LGPNGDGAGSETNSEGLTRGWLPQTAEEAALRYSRYDHVDPFPDIPPALLNSADIADYAAAAGMIWPFHEGAKWLKTCSYQVPLLGKYLYWDGKNVEHRGEIKDGDVFELRPNSIAFVTLEPMFHVPHYIAIRFNLKITNIYRGILLGTGPIVDPGFAGPLSLPLHNLTPNSYKLVGGQGLIWMEFTKISQSRVESTPRALGPFAPRQQGTLYHIPKDKKDHDVYYYVRQAWPSGSIRSSIPDAAEKAAQAARRSRDELARVRTIVAGVGFIGVINSFVGFGGYSFYFVPAHVGGQWEARLNGGVRSLTSS